MSRNDYFDVRSAYLAHYGVKGMKWRVHKFINRAKLKATGMKIRQGVRNVAKSVGRALTNLRARLKYRQTANRMSSGLIGTKRHLENRANYYSNKVAKGVSNTAMKYKYNSTKNNMTKAFPNRGGSTAGRQQGVSFNYKVTSPFGHYTQSNSTQKKKKNGRW